MSILGRIKSPCGHAGGSSEHVCMSWRYKNSTFMSLRHKNQDYVFSKNIMTCLGKIHKRAGHQKSSFLWKSQVGCNAILTIWQFVSATSFKNRFYHGVICYSIYIYIYICVYIYIYIYICVYVYISANLSRASSVLGVASSLLVSKPPSAAPAGLMCQTSLYRHFTR